MCVKCRMNRELSPGRKENLAVHESHPAASEDNIISSCSTVRSAKEVIFYEKFVTLFTDSFRELKAVRTITTMAMLAAVAVILGFSPLNMDSLSVSAFLVFQMVSLIICLDR